MIKKAVSHSILIILLSIALSACNEPPNPLLGEWQQVNPAPAGGTIIVFTPSTMQIGDRRVTVIYQFRDNQVRVSASKKAIIYTFTDPDTVTYEDEQLGTVTLARVGP